MVTCWAFVTIYYVLLFAYDLFVTSSFQWFQCATRVTCWVFVTIVYMCLWLVRFSHMLLLTCHNSYNLLCVMNMLCYARNITPDLFSCLNITQILQNAEEITQQVVHDYCVYIILCMCIVLKHTILLIVIRKLSCDKKLTFELLLRTATICFCENIF